MILSVKLVLNPDKNRITKMNQQRIFDLEKIMRFSKQRATVTPVIETENSSIAIWAVQPQQIVEPHSHPDGQDTWVMLKGTLTYFLGEHQSQTLTQGEVAIAEKGQVHGAINHSQENAVFVSIYSAPQIGYQRELDY
ncbi:cupin domain-containing protein [Synechocystis salina LEGE 00031]|uniref:Cupin domain-containing protein n=3 Tax=Synechocystis TaxID=1142 RepID=A0ABR9VUU2_9SYNC|nr:cupin domain-containing protein [Synechocystis salina LEGE 00041]MBE9255127.1 cupin domain-containing protein [Synechocystis salina LEGE 00031]